MGSVERCRSCGAAVEWRKTAAGKPCPYDAGTDTSHFQTCPQAKDWTKKPAKDETDEAQAAADLAALQKRYGTPQSRDPMPGQLSLFPEGAE